jgi:hypothetical protein
MAGMVALMAAAPLIRLTLSSHQLTGRIPETPVVYRANLGQSSSYVARPNAARRCAQ